MTDQEMLDFVSQLDKKDIQYLLDGIRKATEPLTPVDKKREKVYSVSFLKYTNYTKDTVSKGKGEIGDYYLDVDKTPVLVRESDLDKYRIYGGGYDVIKFVGYLY